MSRRWFAILLLVGIAFRVVLLLNYDLVNGGEVDVYLADEGVVGLMGKHILEGRSLPIFFYGQHYLGALEAYLAALSFAIFGVSITSLRLVTFASSLAVLWGVHTLARRVASPGAARWATALVAIGPMYFLQWNFKARGGFVEHIFLLLAVLILFWRFHFGGERRPGLALVLGLVAGIALWVNQLFLAYLFVLAVVWLVERSGPRHAIPLIAGFLLGASLLIGYNVVHPLATVRALARKAVTLNRVPVTERDEHWLQRGIEKRIVALGQGADKLGMVFGVPPRAGVVRIGLAPAVRKAGSLTRLRQWLAWLPLVVFGAALWRLRPRKDRVGWRWRGPPELMFWLFTVTFLVGYVNPRYMLPAYPLAAILAAIAYDRCGMRGRRWFAAGMIAVLAYGGLSWVDVRAAATSGSQRRIADLVERLEQAGIRYCYSAAPMYHAVFASGERVIVSALQKDRYAPYGDAVGAAAEICYLYRDDQQTKRQHVAFMRLLARKHVTYRKFRVRDFTVLYDFDPRSAITEEDMQRVRHQERTRIGIDSLLPIERRSGSRGHDSGASK